MWGGASKFCVESVGNDRFFVVAVGVVVVVELVLLLVVVVGGLEIAICKADGAVVVGGFFGGNGRLAGKVEEN